MSDNTLYFVVLMSADGLFSERPCDEHFMPREIVNAIAPGIERRYEFKSRGMGRLFMVPRVVEDQKLDEYSSVMITHYEEKVPKLSYQEAEI